MQLVILFTDIYGGTFSYNSLRFLMIEPCSIVLEVICPFTKFVKIGPAIITWEEFSEVLMPKLPLFWSWVSLNRP